MHDVIIAGAGPVGGTLALAIADADLDVLALDARPRGVPPRGDRSLALSHGARLVYERLGVWPRLAAIPDAVTPIAGIDISQAGGFGVTRLSAAEQQLPALGYVVSYLALQSAIDARVAQTATVLRFDATVSHVGGTPAFAAVELVEHPDEILTCRLAVVADGLGTAVRGVSRIVNAYGQVALIAKIWMDAPHEGFAFERFTKQGPMALLPERDHYGLVWTMQPHEAARALAWSDDEFIAQLARHFGTRVTGFARVADRKTFPLALEYAVPSTTTRAVLIGNAAQALHPIAGQGFNLGVRDAFELGQAINESAPEALGERAMIAAYAASRRVDRLAGIAFTHGLTQIFTSELPFVRWPRGVALTMLDAVPPVKKAFTRAMLFGLS